MDIKLLPVSAKSLSTLACSVALGAILFSPASYSQQWLCGASPSSEESLALLDSDCPIGKGLWGKQQPTEKDSAFWIQCGVLAKPLSVKEANKINQKTSADVWAKMEGRNARCLIGPYNNFAQASNDLQAVRTLKPYKQSFIREVSNRADSARIALQSQPGKTVGKSAVDSMADGDIAPSKPQTTTMMPVPQAKAAVSPEVSAVIPTPVDTQISIRRQALISGTEYKVPYSLFSDVQFYMEYAMPWNRLDYEGAATLCQQLGMQLPNDEQWQKLLDENLMKKEQWPMHLPYWGADRTGLFTSGKTNQIKGSSLLNVMCVK
ncbi:SPOR domain-containing protein [Vibrio renipiscarius]|uniref:Sporulation protein n=1 Tax=Vibrio renipiscarius TaxID=1461322 RepID=A0A0C2NWX3_9VIBR|nr:SPOR domain-containing protein [Vibrio renipiscarius]KII78692.1 sporulation protein [Vibrio renipiscarius]KII82460.1 sporulation protein [Vibrio renipiscarius]